MDHEKALSILQALSGGTDPFTGEPFPAASIYQHPEVVRVNPKRQVPVLIDGDVEIFDSTQIFEYFEEIKPQPPLWPTGTRTRARARLLEMKSDEVFFPPVIRLFGLQDDLQGAAARAACEACARYYETMEAALAASQAGGGHLAGPYSFVDIAFYMAQVFAERKGAPMTDATPRLLAWRERVGHRPAVTAVVGPMMRFLHAQGRPVPPFLQFHLQD